MTLSATPEGWSAGPRGIRAIGGGWSSPEIFAKVRHDHSPPRFGRGVVVPQPHEGSVVSTEPTVIEVCRLTAPRWASAKSGTNSGNDTLSTPVCLAAFW